MAELTDRARPTSTIHTFPQLHTSTSTHHILDVQLTVAQLTPSQMRAIDEGDEGSDRGRDGEMCGERVGVLTGL